jgi:membrane-associated protease RseP (regulator of RpoE activity)
MLFTIAMLALLMLALVLHELGHAFAMRERGVRVRRISLLGWGGPKVRLPIKTQWLPETEWVIHPLLPLGAYVMPDSEDMAKLSQRDSNYISGMGPLANFLFALLLLGIAAVIAPGWFSTQMGASHAAGIPLIVTVIAFATAVLWVFRGFFCRVLLLPIGVLTFALLVLGIFAMTSAERMSMLAEFGFLGAWSREFYKWSFEIANYGIREAASYTLVWSAIAVSLALGIINLMPIWPLDGGHMMHHCVPAMSRWCYRVLSLFLFIPILAIGVWNDVLLVGRLLWT